MRLNKGAFGGCRSLTSIVVDNDNQYFTSIDGNLYTKDKTELIQYAIGKTDASFIIPVGVTSIGERAFYDCSGLTSVIIGNGVTSIGSYAFDDCSSLKTVFYKGTAEQWKEISIRNGNTNLTNATRYYYSETEPALSSDGTAYDGNYWHYDTDGKTPVIWKKEN